MGNFPVRKLLVYQRVNDFSNGSSIDPRGPPAKFREILGAAGENETVFVIKGAIVGNHHELSRDEGWTWKLEAGASSHSVIRMKNPSYKL